MAVQLQQKYFYNIGPRQEIRLEFAQWRAWIQ